MGHIDHRWSAIRRGRGDLPPIVSGLQFFGDLSSPNTSIVSGAVAQLGDASGNGRHFTQATSTKRPTFNTTDAAFGGRPSMTFDGTDDGLSRAASYADGSVGCTIYAVIRGGTAGRLYCGNTNGAIVFGKTASTTAFAQYVNVGSTTKTATVHATNAVRLATTIVPASGASAVPSLYVDGSDVGSYSATGASNGTLVGSDHGLGANAGVSANFFNGTLSDLLVYSTAHAASEVALVDEWLRWRNGL